MAHDTSVLPVIDLKPFLDDPHSAAAKEVCKRIAEVLRQTSCLVIRDPRVYVAAPHASPSVLTTPPVLRSATRSSWT